MTTQYEENLVNVKSEHLYELIKNKLILAGLEDIQAQETANHLVFADMSGIHSHGAVRVEYYAERICKGGITNQPNFRFEQTGPSTAIFHGDNGQGHYVVNTALEPAMALAKESGVAVVGISRMGHSGTLSYYMRKIAKENLIGISMCQSDPMVVPFGGAEVYYGTNPIAFCAPSDTDEPLIFDMATTVQAWGKILDARAKGVTIPGDWAVDENGNATTDPNKVKGLLPLAGPKGYGLMMMVDILAGVLLGLPFGKEVSSMYDDLHEGRNLGQLFILIDPEKFSGAEYFKRAVTKSMNDLVNIKPAPGFNSVMYPGQPNSLKHKQSEAEGVLIPGSILNYLESDAIHYNNYEGKGLFAD